jgi:hypothetical protein
MPATYRLEDRVLSFAIEGDPPFEEVAEAIETCRELPELGPATHMLLDLRSYTGNPCESEIRRRAEVMLRLATRLSGRCAIVVNGLLYKGIAHMAGSYMSAWSNVEFDTFEEVQGAKDWLFQGRGLRDRGP